MFLEPVVGAVEHGEGAPFEGTLIAISVVVAVAAVLVAFWVWASGRVNWQAALER